MIRMTKAEQRALRILPDGLAKIIVLLFEVSETNEGHSFISQKWMAGMLGVNIRTIQKKVAKLKSLSVIEVGFGYHTDYQTGSTIAYTYKLNRDVLKEVGRAN